MRKNDFSKMQMDKQYEFYEKAFSYIPKVKEILKRFEGKKITKRIQTAFDKENIPVRLTYESWLGWKLSLWASGFDYREGDRWYNIKNREYLYFAYYKNEKLENCESIFAKMDEKKANLEKARAEEIEVFNNLDSILEEHNKLVESLNLSYNKLGKLRSGWNGTKDFIHSV